MLFLKLSGFDYVTIIIIYFLIHPEQFVNKVHKYYKLYNSDEFCVFIVNVEKYQPTQALNFEPI